MSIFCALAAPGRRRLHRACREALRPGGVVIVECFAPRQRETPAPGGHEWLRSGPTDADRLVAPATLAADFAGLEVLVAREVERTLHEGRFHRGPAVVTQFVARRPLVEPPGAALS